MAHRAKRSAHLIRQRLIDAKRSLISLEEPLISLAQPRICAQDSHIRARRTLGFFIFRLPFWQFPLRCMASTTHFFI
jgi:hypothetical protein